MGTGSEQPPPGAPLSPGEKGISVEPPSFLGSESLKVPADGDSSRWFLGVASYVFGAVGLIAITIWAMVSLDDALTAATGAKCVGTKEAAAAADSMTQPVALLYVAKAILVITVGSFAIALIRTAERLTMPLMLYLQKVEYESRSKAPEEQAGQLAEAIRKLQEMARVPRE